MWNPDEPTRVRCAGINEGQAARFRHFVCLEWQPKTGNWWGSVMLHTDDPYVQWGDDWTFLPPEGDTDQRRSGNGVNLTFPLSAGIAHPRMVRVAGITHTRMPLRVAWTIVCARDIGRMRGPGAIRSNRSVARVLRITGNPYACGVGAVIAATGQGKVTLRLTITD